MAASWHFGTLDAIVRPTPVRKLDANMNSDHDDDDREPPPGDEQPAEDLTVIEAHELFAGKREIWIDHAGVRYRLRITRRNKLILQK